MGQRIKKVQSVQANNMRVLKEKTKYQEDRTQGQQKYNNKFEFYMLVRTDQAIVLKIAVILLSFPNSKINNLFQLSKNIKRYRVVGIKRSEHRPTDSIESPTRVTTPICSP